MVASITDEQSSGVSASNGVHKATNGLHGSTDGVHEALNGVNGALSGLHRTSNGTQGASDGIREALNGVQQALDRLYRASTSIHEPTKGVFQAQNTSYKAPVPSYLLTGKVALVTGSGRGMGRETALELARRGAKVAINYANSDTAAMAVVAEIKAMRKDADAIAIQADVSKVSDIVTLFEKAVEYFGRLDIVCSNSGVVSFGHLKDVTEEEFDRVFQINTKGQFFVAREAYKHLSVGGRIILMGSITGQAKGVPKHAVYSGSKGTIETFVRCMAIDCGDKKITVNAVAPGGIKTDMYHAVCKEYIPNGENLNDEQVDEYAATWSPCNRVGMPIDVARVTCFLASQDGEWINGKVIGVDGAASM